MVIKRNVVSWNICVTNDQWYVPIVVVTIRFFPSIMTYHHRVCNKSNTTLTINRWWTHVLRKDSSSCSTSCTRHANLGSNPLKSHEWGKDREKFTTSGTYPWNSILCYNIDHYLVLLYIPVCNVQLEKQRSSHYYM